MVAASPTWIVGAGVGSSSVPPRPINTPINSIPPSSAIPITAASGETSAGRPESAVDAAVVAAVGAGSAVAIPAAGATRGSPRRVPQLRQ